MARKSSFVIFATAAVGCSHIDYVRGHDPGGCRLERIAVETGVSSFAFDGFSPDGRWLAIGWQRGDDERGTYLLDLRSGGRTPVPELNNGAAFSPDGRMLVNSVYSGAGKTDIVVLDRATRARRVIAPHEEWDWLASYSPDGRSILFNSYRSGNSDVYLYDLGAEQLRRLTSTDRYEAHAQFSPDGRTIVFHRQVTEADFNLYLLDVETGRERQLTSSPREESYPSWSPDGQFIFYSSDRDNGPGKTDIFVMTKSGGVIRKLTSHPAKDAYAFAAPDGEHLYFMSYREPQGVYRIKLESQVDCERS